MATTPQATQDMAKDRGVNNEALEDLRKIRRVVYKKLRPPLDIEAISGEIWLRCWIKHCKPSRAIVALCCIEELRKFYRTRRKEICIDLVPSDLLMARDIEDREDEISNKVELNELMNEARLDTREQMLIFTLYYRGLSLAQASKAMGKSKSTVAKVLRGALDKLRAAWVALDVARKQEFTT